MPESSAPPGGSWPSGDGSGWSAATEHNWSGGNSDDGWGPATAVYSGSGAPAETPAGGWSPAGPLSAREQRATRAAERRAERIAQSLVQPEALPGAVEQPSIARLPERGLAWWAALLLLVAVAGLGALIDTIGSSSAKTGFNIGIVVASVVAILVVKRSHMFPVVIAPPIVYSGAALFQLYIRSSGLHDRKVILDAAANYLVYGFPAIAAATAAVLIVAGVRMIVRK